MLKLVWETHAVFISENSNTITEFNHSKMISFSSQNSSLLDITYELCFENNVVKAHLSEDNITRLLYTDLCIYANVCRDWQRGLKCP